MIFSGSTFATESPLEIMRSTVTQVVSILQDPAYQGEKHRQGRIEKVWEIVRPHLDTQEIAQRALGIHWRKRTPEQQREFSHLFTDLLKHTYGNRLARYTADVQVRFDRERVEDGFAEVYTRLVDPSQENTLPVSYRLHKDGGRWLMYDVVIGHVSLVRNYRTQFNRIIHRSSYQDLVHKIRDKLQELSTTSLAADELTAPEG
jgi:phospholipid transport system substrate-binding protein